MRCAQALELNEDAVPTLVLEVSEQRLKELFPVSFTAVDSLSEPEPSIAALLQLASGTYCVVTFGSITHRATISFPVTADVGRAAASVIRETGLRKDEVRWIAEHASGALRFAAAPEPVASKA
jgi:hypothetical protein